MQSSPMAMSVGEIKYVVIRHFETSSRSPVDYNCLAYGWLDSNARRMVISKHYTVTYPAMVCHFGGHHYVQLCIAGGIGTEILYILLSILRTSFIMRAYKVMTQNN
jgi:hypothetical protein